MDQFTCDEEGRPWNFDLADCRRRAKELVRSTRPLMLIACPPCTLFSTLQNLNPAKDSEAFKKACSQAAAYIRFSIELVELQLVGGRYFPFEHPRSATCWELPDMIMFE